MRRGPEVRALAARALAVVPAREDTVTTRKLCVLLVVIDDATLNKMLADDGVGEVIAELRNAIESAEIAKREHEEACAARRATQVH